MERVIGIDLGTTNSVVAFFENGQAHVIQNAEGSRTTPSVVFFKSPEEIIVGELAKRQLVTNPKQVVQSIKRFMGARYSEIVSLREGVGYNIIEGENDTVLIDVGWARVTPEMVSAEILKKMKLTAEEYFGELVERAVVTVPAYFNDNQRAATKMAAELAGLHVLRIINEPTAAALAYGVDRNVQQQIAVFDFGGGTFDMSVLELDRDVFEVKSTRGDTFLGGDDIDQILCQAFAERFLSDTGVDVRQSPEAFERLREACEKVKCELSTTDSSIVSLPFLSASDEGPLHLSYTIDRKRFEELVEPLLPRISDCCHAALKDSGIAPNRISDVLLVGGSTRIPIVQQLVKSLFKKAPNRALNPDEAVAIGAAIQGSVLTGGLREVLLLDVTPLSLGIELAGNVFSILIPRNSSIPTSANRTFTTVRDGQTSVKVHVLQGERKIANENHTLGRFRLTGITPAPKEIPEIKVSFAIDANGILNVSASDATSGISDSVTIENISQVTPEEASSIVRAAEAAADQDREFIRRNYLQAQGAKLTEKLNRVADEVEDADVAKEIREAIFKFDIACSSMELLDAEAALSQLKSLAALLGELPSADEYSLDE
jgi:molecular chaperone DnaK